MRAAGLPAARSARVRLATGLPGRWSHSRTKLLLPTYEPEWSDLAPRRTFARGRMGTWSGPSDDCRI